MNFPPLLTRELRVASRRKRTWWLRSVAAGILALIAVLNLTGGGNLTQSTGETLFTVLSIALFILALFSGSLITAGAWAEENAEGTVDLLLLTRLRGADIVIGRLLGDGLFVLTLIAATLPVFAVPLLAGGVGIDTVLCVAVAILFTSVLSILSAAFVAVTETDGRIAVFKTVLLLLGFMTGWLAWVIVWIVGFSRFSRLVEGDLDKRRNRFVAGGMALLMFASLLSLPMAAGLVPGIAESVVFIGPVATFVACLDQNPSPAGVIYQLLQMSFCMGTMLIITSVTIGKHAAVFRESLNDPSANLWAANTSVARRAPSRARRDGAEDSPILRLATPGVHVRTLGKIIVFGVGGLFLVAGFEYVLSGGGGFYRMLMGVVWFSWFLVSILAPVIAVRFYVESRRQGAFELLLATPLPRTEFIRPVRTAWWRLLRGPIVVLSLGFLVGRLVLFLGMSGRGESVGLGMAAFTASALLVLALRIFELVASAWLAMWLALKLKTPRAAAFLAFLTMMLGSYLINLIGWLFIGFAMRGSLGDPVITQAMVFLPGALFTAAIFWYARRRVHRFFGVANDGHPAADPSQL